MTQQGNFGPSAGESQETAAPQPGSAEHATNPPASDMVEEGAPVDATADADGLSEADELGAARAALTERTGDLQRLQAEFLNYKRRVDRDRELVKENATYAVLAPMLDVLDNIDRARDAGELEGGFKGVAEQLERVVTGLGLTRFGTPGDEFDPRLHEALSHVGTSPDVSVVTAQHIAKSGYKIGDRVVRPAQVLVVDPEEPSATNEPNE
ncbi:MAG: GrpE protein cofactor [Marmoricola sp.]|nr:GrpE protein cofactor [Marmoricola sp.]